MIKRALISLLLLFLVILPVFADELDDLLYALPGVSSVQTLQSEDNIAKRLVMFEQPVDANDASKGTFLQRIVLKHRGFDRPTVIVTEGYSNEYALHPRYTEELSDLLEANTLMVEHRYNGASSPLIQRGLEGKEQYSSTL